VGTGLDVIIAALRTPGAQKILVSAAQQILDGQARYKELHWGRKGQGATTVQLPRDQEPLVQLGALTRIGYLTQKGPADFEPTEYVHTFSPALPWVYVNGDRDLLIVRGRSQYTVKRHGIIG
jgi:hypothetical protein